MAIFKRRLDEHEGSGSSSDAALTSVLGRLARPCARITADGSAGEAHSFLGGFASLPPGEAWPTIAGVPALFVGQICFDEVPPLPGFPARGLLQWFVAANDTYGLTFGETAGLDGFLVRWYDAVPLAVEAPPDATPPTADPLFGLAFEVPPGTRLRFETARSLPGWAELPADVRGLDAWGHLAAGHGEDPADAEFVYEEYVRTDEGLGLGLAPGSKLGGFPSFTQDDVRGTGNFPPPEHPSGALIVELDGTDFGGWGDAGIAHLFGDPAALGRGELDSVRYHWDCS